MNNQISSLNDTLNHLGVCVDKAPIAIGMARNGLTIYANAKYLEMFGFKSLDEISGRPFIEQIAPQDRDQMMAWVQKVISGQPVDLEMELTGLRSNGTQFPFYVTVARVELEDGPADMGVFINITNRKHTEEALAASEAKYRLLYENMIDAFASVNMDGRVVEFNESYRKMLGYGSEELTTLTYGDVTPEKWHALESKIITDQVLVRGYSDLYEKEYKKKDGTVFPIELRTVLIKDSAGKPASMWALIRDITERKKHENTLKASEEKYYSLFNNSEVGMFRTKLDGSEILEMNEKYLQIFGYSREEMKGKSSLQFWADPGEREEMIRRLSESGRVVDFECKMYNKQGETINCMTSLRVFRDHNVLEGSIIDITERKKIENALKASEDKFRKAFYTSPDAITINRFEDGVYVSINRGFTEITGYTEQECVGRSTLELNIWADLNERDAAFKVLKNDGTVKNLEARFYSKNGDIIYGLISSSIIELEGVAHIISITRDITQRKLIEDALEESEKKLEKVFMTCPDPIVVTRLDDGVFVSINTEFTRLFGYTEADIAGKTSLGLNLWKNAQDRVKFIDMLKDKGEVRNFDTCFVKKNGEEVFGQISASLMELNGVRLIVNISRDLTEKKQTEEKLAERSRFIESIVNLTPNILYIYDIVEKKNVYSNNGIQKVLSYSPEELKEMDDKVISTLMHPDDFQKYINEIVPQYAVLKNNEPLIHQFRMKHRSGKWRWLNANEIVYLRQPDGSPQQIFGMINDITDIKRAEDIIKRDKEALEVIVKERTQELINVHADLERAKRLADIGVLATTVAHEIRNPLAAINLAASNIARKSKEENLRPHLDTITKKVLESDQIINNLLFYSRFRLPEYEPINLYNLLNECIDHARMQFKAKKLDIRKQYDSLENILFEADTTQIKEVFNNILGNAFDAVNALDGIIIISAELSTESVVIRIYDNGLGIAQENINKVFDPFFTTKTRGTGLGLPVSRHIINSHNGTIGIESAAGKGTTVTITLPRTH